MSGDASSFLSSLQQFGVKVGLENIRALTASLGHPDRAFRSIHVGGTNGKGSVTAMLDQILREAGLRVGRYTSPHLVELNERFVIDGRPVTTAALDAAVMAVRAIVIRELGDPETSATPRPLTTTVEGKTVEGKPADRLTTFPTFFEITTAAAFELFQRARVQVAVCEVGLGGRLDATNVLAPEVSAITSIGLDHEQYLGHTIAAIAGEKAGIIKPGVPIVTGRLPDDAMQVVKARAADLGAPLIDASAEVRIANVAATDRLTAFDLVTPVRDYGRLSLGLRGRHQIDNAAVAVRVLETLDLPGLRIDAGAIRRGLERVRWPGRLEQMSLGDGRTILLDAAHNPEGAEALATFLSGADPHPLVFAAMRDKDVGGILRSLVPVISAMIVTRASNPRSAPVELIEETARRFAPSLPIARAETPHEALAAAWRLDRSIVAAGSIFLLGDILGTLRRS